MNKAEFWSFFAFFLFVLNVVFCGKSALFSLNDAENHIHENFNANDNRDSLFDTGKILKRDKRYLLWTGGGISKVNK